MQKIILAAALIIACSAPVFSGGQEETGRDSASSEVGQGQLLPVGAVDPASYLNDFKFEKTNDTDSPLLVSIDLLRDRIWEKGEDISLRISLITNGIDYYSRVGGCYILYVQNPELFRNSEFRTFLQRITQNHRLLEFCFYDPEAAGIKKVENVNDINRMISDLGTQRKEYSSHVQLQNILESMNSSFKGERTHIIWITDENIIEKKEDSGFFEFAVNVLSSGNTTFSYLGYGEVPNWITMNSSLVKHNGNSYYAADEKVLCEKLEKDIGFFERPAVEDINIRIVWSQYVRPKANFYPVSLYSGISSFNPVMNNSRPTETHIIGGMKL